MNRRRFLKTAAQTALLATYPCLKLAEAKDTVTISILHTTDLHGHILPAVDYENHPDLGGLARCATQIKQWQKDNPLSILVDVGDVYQGTEVSFRSRGRVMIDCFNALHYDAWVVGNHEFDWGLEPFAENVAHSTMPVLCCNVMTDLPKVRPYLIKEIAGFKIALVAVTTPGLPYWLPPEFLRNFTILEPMESLRRTLREVSTQQPDAIVLAGHMGVRERDDFANSVDALTREFSQVAVFLGGHTHKNCSSLLVNNVLYTQADHFGIYVGKVDLIFDSLSRRLLERSAFTVVMDHQIKPDPLVLSVAKNELAAADQVMLTPVGELLEPLDISAGPNRPCEVERLIGSAMMLALEERGTEVDVVVHGLFDLTQPLLPGLKTISDLWNILPYENQIVTIDLSRSDLLALVQDFCAGGGKDARAIMGVKVVGKVQGKGFCVSELRSHDGGILPDKKTYRVAMNSYDSQSGGQRFFTVARLVATAANFRKLHSIMTRDALIEFFVKRRRVNRASLLV